MTALEIPKKLAGQRLDAALASLAPDLSLRARRRLIDNGSVLVNGKPGRAGQRLRVGDTLELRAPADTATSSNNEFLQSVRLVATQGDFALLAKPAGLHSVSLAGSDTSSLESCLPQLLPNNPAARLLQRLDRDTSGLVCVALSDTAAEVFRQWEHRGQCRKHYVALLQGELAASITATRAIDTNQRLKSRVTVDEAPSVRHTSFEPLACGPLCEFLPEMTGSTQPVTLAGCVIHRGCRHQIRAHAAHVGHPLVGDSLYDSSEPGLQEDCPGTFWLHAAAIVAPRLRCTLQPAWHMAPQALTAVEKWLETLPRYGIDNSVI